MDQLFAPGARVEIRDAEWVIRRVDVSSDKGYQLTCDGISELVRGKDAIFLSQLEDEIRILDPATTELVQDTSNAFEQSLLYIESQLRQAIPNDQKVHVAHLAAMDLVPYQLDPTIQALKQPRQRILIADAVGLGKTLEAGILVTELMQRGRGKRILVLTLKSMMTQFQKEFWNRFTIPLTRLDSAGLQRVRSRIPGNHNPFYYYDKSIISIDTLKQDNEFKNYLEQAYWDIIVIDEAHNVADRGSSSQRAALAQLLASRSDTLIMLSATPHDGRAKSFASLMNMLDPTAISDTENYVKEDFNNKGLVVRRFKKDIRDQVDTEFKERTVYSLKHKASMPEEAAYDALLEIPFTYKGQFDTEKQGHLIRIGLQKALFSSPAACLVSVDKRLKKLKSNINDKEDINQDVQAEINGLESFNLALRNIDNAHWTKYIEFIGLIKGKQFDWNKKNTEDRLVIFSERIETLKFLEEQLKQDLKLKDVELTQLHGGMSDIEQQAIVENFGKPETKLRVLLCSDVASEGINLHYLSHRLIHFDLPWSLMVFQQRNGRVDRYGQTEEPQLYYLITESENETIRGDTRILEILKQKDEQAYKNIGDPATFMKVHDADAEQQLTEDAMADGLTAEAFDQKYQADESNEGDELLSLFFSGKEEPTTGKKELPIAENYSIYNNDYHFVKAAFEFLNRQKQMADVNYSDERQTLSIIAPDDLKDRFRFLPSEIWPENGEFILTANVESYQKEIIRSRNDEHAWPKQHYLWHKHPVIEWLQERMLGNTGRHEALVMGLNTELGNDEAIFLVSALIPNRKANPVIWSWYAVFCKAQKVSSIEPLEETLKHFNLGGASKPNTTKPINLHQLNELRVPVVKAVKEAVLAERKTFDEENLPKLHEQLDELSKLRSKQVQQLDLWLDHSKQEQKIKDSKRNKKMNRIEAIFTDYQRWIEDTMQTEPVPYIQLIAVIARAEG